MDLSILAQVDTDQIMQQVGLFFQTLRPETLGDILVYVVFVLCLITTFLLPDGNDMAGNILYAALILCLFNITVGEQWYNRADVVYAFPAFIARVATFLLPWIAAGAARKSPKERKGGAVIPLLVLAGLVGLIYTIGTFAVPEIMSQVVI